MSGYATGKVWRGTGTEKNPYRKISVTIPTATYGSSAANKAAAAHQAHLNREVPRQGHGTKIFRGNASTPLGGPQTEEMKRENAAVLAQYESKAISTQFREDEQAKKDVAAALQAHNNKHVGATAPSVTGGERGNPYHDKVGKFTTKGQAT